MLRGFCSKCKEFRSDNGIDAWDIIWRNGSPTCEKCKGYVDIWSNQNEIEKENIKKNKEKINQ